MHLHKLLQRQLKRMELSENQCPTNITKWQELLERINKSYIENDQERYLLERSMEISSNELQELNDKLETAQQIVKLGYWHYNSVEDKTVWSKGLYTLFGLGPDMPIPNLQDTINMVHEDDRENFIKSINQALTEQISYDIELRMRRMDARGEYRWFQVSGSALLNNNQQIEGLHGIAMDITIRKETELKVHNLHQQLLSSARRAGMADVSTSILHNVGNILNSLNVSVELIKEYIENPAFNNFTNLKIMLLANRVNLADFLLNDPKGKLVPYYIIELAEAMETNKKVIFKEIINLVGYVKHIREITAMQHSLSGTTSIIETCNVKDLIDNSIKMCGQIFQTNHINLVLKINYNGSINSDRAKILQILVNLLQNSKDALIASEVIIKEITISVNYTQQDETIAISVIDNGIGMTTETLSKIFLFGFTSKEGGHGFGLHSSAIASKELGGSLNVESRGPGQGAIFTLRLPLNINKG